VPVAIETGVKRAFASAIEWPGWCRAGRDEATAIEALLSYGPRYASVVRGTRLGFPRLGAAPVANVVERLEGTATTDFGAPDVATSLETRPMDAAELRRSTTILRAAWRSLDAAAEAAKGRALRAGPRGGGRDLRKILEHVLDAEEGYLGRLSWKAGPGDGDRTERVRGAVLEALGAAAEHGWRRRRAAASGGRRGTSSAALRGTRSTTRGRSRIGRNSERRARRSTGGRRRQFPCRQSPSTTSRSSTAFPPPRSPLAAAASAR
jgi:hypothetical protein